MPEVPQTARDVLTRLEQKRDRISRINPQTSSEAIAIYDVAISLLHIVYAFIEADNG